MIQKMPSRAQKIPNKIWNCRELNKKQLLILQIFKFGIEFELKFREPI
jgi:hypothetical protein